MIKISILKNKQEKLDGWIIIWETPETLDYTGMMKKIVFCWILYFENLSTTPDTSHDF